MIETDIVVVGSLNTDLVARVSRFPDPGETMIGQGFHTYGGGKGANQAVAAAKLGARVSMLGQVGADSFGDIQIQNLDEFGVHTGAIRRDEHQPTGTAIIGVESSGENRIIVIPGANGTFRPEHLDDGCQALISRTKFLLLQLEIPLPTVALAIDLAKAAKVTVILDPAPAPRQGLPPEWLGEIDILTPNVSELSALTGTPLCHQSPIPTIVEAARNLCAQGSPAVIAKLGARGALRVTSDTVDHWTAPEVFPVDTTAAGDCFNAAYAVQRLRGCDENEAGTFAVTAASFSTTRPGAQPAMPTREELARQKG